MCARRYLWVWRERSHPAKTDMEEDCWSHRNEAWVVWHLPVRCSCQVNSVSLRFYYHSDSRTQVSQMLALPPHPALSPAEHGRGHPRSYWLSLGRRAGWGLGGWRADPLGGEEQRPQVPMIPSGLSAVWGCYIAQDGKRMQIPGQVLSLRKAPCM